MNNPFKTCCLLLLLLTVFQAIANPPRPPFGKRWVLNTDFSDEFNGNSLDTEKWNDYSPTWKGRAPGLFMPSMITVEDGFLKIRGEKMTKDTIVNGETYNIKCGAVTSKKLTASFGYYECRFKANKTTLSTTFWFSSRRSHDGPDACDDKYSQEWDVQECIGRTGNFQGSWFANGMHSNAHFWYTDCTGTKYDYRAPQEVRFEDTKLASDDFNTYGGWWVDATKARYYYNDGTPKEHSFYDAVKSEPFAETMGMNMVVETYPFPWIELPNDTELADPEKTTSYYDWVRAYSLVDVDDPNLTPEAKIVTNGDFETGSLTGWTGWGTPGAQVVSTAGHVYEGTYAVYIAGAGAPEQNITLRQNTDYKLTCYAKATAGSISLGIKSNSSGITIKSIEISANEYQPYSLTFNSGDYTDLKLYFYAQAGEEGYADNFEIEELNPVQEEKEIVVLYDEKVILYENLTALPSEKQITIPYDFMTNEDRQLTFELHDPTGAFVKDTTLTAYAGYGVTNLLFDLPTTLQSQNGYTLTAMLKDLENGTEISSSKIYLNISFPTAIDDNLKQKNVYLYPNPASEMVYINGIEKDASFRIISLSGTVMMAGSTTGNSVSVKSLPAGTYILEVEQKHFMFIRD